jgi:hypothetical protein
MKTMREWRYNSTHSLLWHYFVVRVSITARPFYPVLFPILGASWVEPRAGLGAVGKRKCLPFSGIELRQSRPYSVSSLNETKKPEYAVLSKS